MRAYNLSGEAGVIASAILPTSFLGNPLSLSLFHDNPPSIDLKTPLPGPPLTLIHVLSFNCQAPANKILELLGSITISDIPVLSSIYKVCFHVTPPLSLIYTPLSFCGE